MKNLLCTYKQKNILIPSAKFTLMKEIKLVVAVFIVFILYIQPILATIGVAQEYMEDNTLYLSPGAQRQFKITLQNSDSSEISVQVVVSSEIANIINPESYYTIPPTFYDKFVYLNISIPPTTPLNTEYTIGYSVQPLVSSEGTMIPLSLRINKQFKVYVGNKSLKPIPPVVTEEVHVKKVEQPIVVKDTNLIITYVKGVLILAIIIFLLIFIWKKSYVLSVKVIKKRKKR